jgi:hypothetical protein
MEGEHKMMGCGNEQKMLIFICVCRVLKGGCEMMAEAKILVLPLFCFALVLLPTLQVYTHILYLIY